MPELGENREDAAGSLNSVYRPSWLLLPACNLFFWVYPRVVSMSMPNYSGSTNRLDIDRYENVKWVGIVAGYYDLTPGQVTRTYEMPVLIETKGMIFKTNEAKMGLLGMNLYFGPTSIQEVPGP